MKSREYSKGKITLDIILKNDNVRPKKNPTGDFISNEIIVEPNEKIYLYRFNALNLKDLIAFYEENFNMEEVIEFDIYYKKEE